MMVVGMMIFTCSHSLQWEDGGRDGLERYLGSFLFTVLHKIFMS